ncbi:3-phosphoglycerate dehydrogenase [Caldanaerobacter subterraneus subsp. yonseiensis KB-1]|uniref:D-3-phosphoglycerate dehydrogenase n=2 Tax=Caldanaerobacter subterraneus TaxID=911092 RepID=U5CJF3_CALSX|nr:phosphoglycerate dehydrogenase [Caldanaerobacter subterraneus]ERM93070.1 3-phosphoglycerate dehydrogenase [Caldanaerobacter subterraneus subsp. yonseiensis KB-1]
MKIIITEKISENGIDYLKKYADVDVKTNISREELLEVIKDYDAIIVRSATKVDRELIEKGEKLKVIGRAGNGVDNIDVEAATQRGILVVNTPAGNTIAAAELTIGLMLAIARNIPQAYHAALNGDFRRDRFKGVELNGKTVGIIGLGRIGSLVASRLAAFNMRVIAYDPYMPDERFEKCGVKRVTLDELLEQSDFITIHIPKTEETKKMIGEKEFKKMKKGVRIVNAARGGIIDEKALYNAIKEGIVAAVGLDVLEVEPKYNVEHQDFHNRLLELPNVVFTPHLGASTYEAQENISIAIAQEVISALNGNLYGNIVNLPGLKSDEFSQLKPYMKLAEVLGALYYQINETPAKLIEVIYRGEVAKSNTEIVTLYAIKGFLKPILEEDVSVVNAKLRAKEMGIEIVEGKIEEIDHYSSLVILKITDTNGKRTQFAGTTYGEELRIVEYMGHKVNFEPTEYMLFVKNKDVPGVIGHIGNVLGDFGINISTMQVSPNKNDGTALMLVSTDKEIPEEAVESLNKLNSIIKAKAVKGLV